MSVATALNYRNGIGLSLPELIVDFNMMGRDAEFEVFGSHLTGIVPEPGELVLLRDCDGDTCLGALVRARKPRGYDVRADLRTWVDGPA